MKNQTDRFYTTAVVFAGCSVYTTLFEPPLPPIQWLSLVRERHGMLGSYCNLCNSQKPGARSAPVLPTKPWSAVSGLNARVRAGPRLFAEKTVLCGKGFLAKCSGPHRSAPNLPRKSWSVPGFWANARVRAAPRRFCREHRAPCWFLGKMLRSEFAEKTVLCEISLVDARARAKPCYASALHAWVRAGPRRICRENRAPC